MSTELYTPPSLTRAAFEALVARGYNQVPVIARLPLGALTPRDLLRAVEGEQRLLLESTRAGQDPGRYSIVVARALETFTAKGNSWQVGDTRQEGSPLEGLRGLMRRYRGWRPAGAPLFVGGAVGYFGYECNQYLERLPRPPVDDLGLPDIYLVITDRFLVVDHLDGAILLIASGRDYDLCLEGLRELARIVDRARVAARAAASAPAGQTAEFESNLERTQYEEAVKRVQEYIRSGDVYQVNLSQRLQVPFRGSGLGLYESLSSLSPVHFAAYLQLNGFEVASASPERLVRLEGGRVATRPIAGTRRRGTAEEDRRYVDELRTDEKEVSEHAMLVDLERNDLGRVCRYGSVQVTKLMEIVKYAHVIHIESEVEGELAEGQDFVDVFAAVFPGGTITGMPKVRTMEIIAELEPTARALYSGSIGYISFTGEMDLNIVIRTVILKDGQAYVNVGGGVVWDSTPSREYKETLNKARSQLTALAQDREASCS